MANCCDPRTRDIAPISACPKCASTGRKVTNVTIESILASDSADRLVGVTPRFCPTPSCPVLYFGSDGSIATTDEANVRVGVKENADDSPLCYCFGISRADIAADVAASGTSAAPARIQAEVRAGHCACEQKNPSGSCCLGDVRAALRLALAAAN